MRIYMSKYMNDDNSYKRRVLYPILGSCILLILFSIVLGLMIAVNGGVNSSFHQWMITIMLFMFVVVINIFLHHIGTISHRDALIFFVDNNDALYVVDAKDCAISNKGFWGMRVYSVFKFLKVLSETGKVIARIKTEGLQEEDMRTGRIKKYAFRITEVNKLQNVPAGKFVVCSVSRNNMNVGTRQFDISHHTEELFNLMKQRSFSKEWVTSVQKYTKQIGVSALVTIICLSVCVCSYPTVGLLPESVYFPCLFGMPVPFIFLGTYILKRRKGK